MHKTCAVFDGLMASGLCRLSMFFVASACVLFGGVQDSSYLEVKNAQRPALAIGFRRRQTGYLLPLSESSSVYKTHNPSPGMATYFPAPVNCWKLKPTISAITNMKRRSGQKGLSV
jgi:hypothetical protein